MSIEGLVLAKSITFAPVTMCKVPSEGEYTQKMRAAVSGPLGDKSAEFEKAELFVPKRYKVATTISTDQDDFFDRDGVIRHWGRSQDDLGGLHDGLLDNRGTANLCQRKGS